MMTRNTRRIQLVVATVLLLTIAVWAYRQRESAVVTLRLGEPYELVQKASPVLPDRNRGWGALPEVIAKFRFDDPVYGFTTPRSVILDLGMGGPDNRNVTSIRLSPQTKPLPLDDALSVVANIQDQLHRSGWRPFQYSEMRAIEDTPQLRSDLHECRFPMSVWNGGDRYQVSLDVGCHSVPQQPGKERYIVTLELGPPFWTDRSGE
ncbi:hypothetical protein AWB77_06558 [Caballeronia fortuita]|uniref:Uncharacterized protein n=1 Tax=Caballeronia fortuita TaxID=1777138 RepID=A0A158E929_9BURK|nr:hypothetical protein [Caballeronia fortuita]SAL02457.1 hypothetical protein AWB77_06558 [Caballeronia fortuita]